MSKNGIIWYNIVMSAGLGTGRYVFIFIIDNEKKVKYNKNR